MNFIVLCLCVSLSGVLCEYLNKEEGDKCEWEGLQGTCVEETRCLTTIDDDSPKHPVCYNELGRKIICCTDCELINSTKNAIFIPPTGLIFKSGQKARDKCLQYIQELPYKCKEDRFYAGISRDLDTDKKCYRHTEWEVGGTSGDRDIPRAEHPYSAYLGYGEALASANWHLGGFIISNKYILTASHIFWYIDDPVTFVALGVNNRSDSLTGWQTHVVKRLLKHPDEDGRSYYNDIGLIETENTITFNKNVLPACLHVEAATDEPAISPTWRDLKIKTNDFIWADTMNTVNLDKFSEIECKQAYFSGQISKLDYGINYTTQMCYGSRSHSLNTCKVQSGYPLLIEAQFASCINSVIGVTAYTYYCGVKDNGFPALFTRVAPYIPWIESVVWP